MRAEAQGQRVALYLSWDDPETYLPALNELIDAQEEYDAHRGDLDSAALGPFIGRVAVAEDDLDELFSETISIESAEKVHAQLYGAIIAAKINAGRYDYRYSDGD